MKFNFSSDITLACGQYESALKLNFSNVLCTSINCINHLSGSGATYEV